MWKCDDCVTVRSVSRRLMKFIRVFAVAVVALCGARSASAQQDVTVIFHGTIGDVQFSPFADLYPGMPFSGAYTYNAFTPDTNPLPQFAEYLHTAGPYGMTVTIGSHTFHTDPFNPYFLVGINNDGPADNLGIASYTNSLAEGYPLSMI